MALIQGPLVMTVYKDHYSGALVQLASYKELCTFIRHMHQGLYIKDFQYIQRSLYRYLKKKPNLIQGPSYESP